MIGFEILHYQSIEDTKKCVESILNNIEDSIIVIVDNASSNNSGTELRELYTSYDNIICILLEKNLGFAQGNNVGYEYIRKHYDCDFICCVNNDTIVVDQMFERKLNELYIKYEFGVLAPKVILKDKSIQRFNPYLHDKEYYINEIDLLERSGNYREYVRNKGKIAVMFVRFPKMMYLIRRMKQKMTKPYKHIMQNVVLHGCFLVFSKKFIEKVERPFNSKTFMYREEELLYLKAKKMGLSTLYCEDICIKHMEDSATDFEYRDKESKYQFVKRNQIDSLKILLEELNESHETDE